ncbi:unnamed protein product, partial [Symbiodinium necroappetens]
MWHCPFPGDSACCVVSLWSECLTTPRATAQNRLCLYSIPTWEVERVALTLSGLLGIAEGFLLMTSFPVDERKSMSVTRCIPFMSTLAPQQKSTLMIKLGWARQMWRSAIDCSPFMRTLALVDRKQFRTFSAIGPPVPVQLVFSQDALRSSGCVMKCAGDAELLDAEQLHKLTQMLIDRFGCTSPATLDRIGHVYVYVVATSGRLEQGLAELEFRGYVAAVRASGDFSQCDESGIKPELDSFEESAWDQHEHEDWRELSTTQKPAEAVPGKKTRGGQRKRPTRKADSMESSFHLSFEGKHPKAAVNMFLFRYTGRDVIKDEDFGTAAKRDPMASNAVCTSRRGEAEQSTSAKLANQAAEHLPPTMRVVKYHTRETKSQREDLRNSGQL